MSTGAVLVASANGAVGLPAGRAVLEAGGSALDAEAREMLTPAMAALWERRIAPQLAGGTSLVDVAGLAADPERAGGTVNVLARDRQGGLAAAVSTSGWAWKYPGRLGDSPCVGAGGYADDRGGAAGCTGMGELAIGAGSARMLVAALAVGRTAEQACREAILDLRHLASDRPPLVGVVALAADGSHAGASTHPGKTYAFWQDGMAEVGSAPRIEVPEA